MTIWGATISVSACGVVTKVKPVVAQHFVHRFGKRVLQLGHVAGGQQITLTEPGIGTRRRRVACVGRDDELLQVDRLVFGPIRARAHIGQRDLVRLHALKTVRKLLRRIGQGRAANRKHDCGCGKHR